MYSLKLRHFRLIKTSKYTIIHRYINTFMKNSKNSKEYLHLNEMRKYALKKNDVF